MQEGLFDIFDGAKKIPAAWASYQFYVERDNGKIDDDDGSWSRTFTASQA